MGLKAPSFFPEAPIQKPTKNHLVGTKHAPITQEMPEDVGDLCKTLLLPQHWENYKDFRNSCFRNRIKDQIQQELGAKTKYISYYVTGEPSGQKIGCSCAQLTGSALSAPLTGRHALWPRVSWDHGPYFSCRAKRVLRVRLRSAVSARCFPQLIQQYEGLSWKGRLIISAPSHHPGQIYGGGTWETPTLWSCKLQSCLCKRKAGL